MAYELYYWGACGEFYGRVTRTVNGIGLAPADAAADAKALQICCDAVDFITEATKPDFASERKQKWLTHFAAVTSADAPVNYGDFLLFTALELAISSFTAAIDESEYPVSMRRPPRHRRDRPRHSRAGRPRRVVEQDAEDQSRGRPEGQGEEAHARRAQQGLVSIIQ